MNQDQISRMAEDFWRLVGRPEPFPRVLESSVAWALPLAIVKLPRLSIFELINWLEQREISISFQAADRRLRACLVARNGRGFVFLDGADVQDEQRFSLAHEIAHFLLDYLEPRQRTRATLGEPALEVFDGKRVPTTEERLSAILRDAELTPFLHLMDRSPSGEITAAEVLERENRATRLALELLAPWNVAMATIGGQIHEWSNESAVDKAKSILIETFGLPDNVAERYGRTLVINRRTQRTFREWLGDEQQVSNFSDSTGIKK